MALRSLVLSPRIRAGNRGTKPASTKAHSRSIGRQRSSPVPPESRVFPGYQKPIRRRVWILKRAFLEETAHPVLLVPNALNQSKNHASLASRPANIMKPCNGCESDKRRRSSASLMLFGPASKAPMPKLSDVVDYAAPE